MQIKFVCRHNGKKCNYVAHARNVSDAIEKIKRHEKEHRIEIRKQL